MPYLPGKDLILSRLPRQDWFTLDEAALHAGWSRNFMRDRCQDGTLANQAYQKTGAARRKRKSYCSYRIHRDDLALFILRHGNKHFGEEKPFRDVATIVRGWPVWMQRELVKFVSTNLAPSKPEGMPTPQSDPSHS